MLVGVTVNNPCRQCHFPCTRVVIQMCIIKDSSKYVTVGSLNTHAVCPPFSTPSTLIIEGLKKDTYYRGIKGQWVLLGSGVSALPPECGAMLCLYLYAICLPPRTIHVVSTSPSTMLPPGKRGLRQLKGKLSEEEFSIALQPVSGMSTSSQWIKQAAGPSGYSSSGAQYKACSGIRSVIAVIDNKNRLPEERRSKQSETKPTNKKTKRKEKGNHFSRLPTQPNSWPKNFYPSKARTQIWRWVQQWLEPRVLTSYLHTDILSITPTRVGARRAPWRRKPLFLRELAWPSPFHTGLRRVHLTSTPGPCGPGHL